MLHTATKARARGPAGRAPPSRAKLRAAAQAKAEAEDDLPEPDPVPVAAPRAPTRPARPGDAAKPDTAKPDTAKPDAAKPDPVPAARPQPRARVVRMCFHGYMFIVWCYA